MLKRIEVRSKQGEGQESEQKVDRETYGVADMN